MPKADTQHEVLDEVNRELYARNAELAVRNKTLSLLREIDDITLKTLETEGMTRKIALLLAKEFNFAFVSIGLVRQKKQVDWIATTSSHPEATVCFENMAPFASVPMRQKSNPCISALGSNKPKTVQELASLFPPKEGNGVTEDCLGILQVKRVMIFPMYSGKDPFGVLVIGHNREEASLTKYENETIAATLKLIVIAIQKAETYSDLQKTTKKLKSANKKLHELDLMKTEFLSIASHELRTPLAVTKGYVAMLTGGMVGEVNKKQEEALNHIKDSTESLILLVNHFLDLTRIESGKLTVKEEEIELQEGVVGWVVYFLKPRIEEKGLKINFSPDKKKYFVKGDQDRLREVLMNLVGNAMKYTEKGKITVNIASDNASVTVTVSDTGYGLTAQDKRHLFEKFAMGSASKHVKTSSGFGLFVSHNLIKAMKGEIWAESDGPGKGSTFSIKLPLLKK